MLNEGRVPRPRQSLSCNLALLHFSHGKGACRTKLASVLPLEAYHLSAAGADDGTNDPFARRARLLDIQDDGQAVVSQADDATKTLSQRFMRLVAERGDFSALSADTIGTQAAVQEKGKNEVDGVDDERKAQELEPEKIYELQRVLQEQLDVARTELTTGLDLLSVLMPLTDPPTVDVNSLPLPPETLKVQQLHKATKSNVRTDNDDDHRLALATSLSSTREVAQTFFHAANPLFEDVDGASDRSRAWQEIIKLRHSTHHDLVPLGAAAGASFVTQPDHVARNLGVFVGCQESREPFRRRSILQMSDLVSRASLDKRKSRHRNLVATVVFDGEERHRSVWACDRRSSSSDAAIVTPEDRVTAASRSAIAEELFAILANEARTDEQARATFSAGSRSKGDGILVEGTGWTLKLTMTEYVHSEDEESPLAQGLVACARLLLVEEYGRRRRAPNSWTRPIVQTLAALLSHVYRCRYIRTTLDAITKEFAGSNVAIKAALYGATRQLASDPADALAEATYRVLASEQEIGGRATLTVNDRAPFPLTFSQVLPFAPSPSANVFAITHQPLLLGNVPVPSLPHLKSFLVEQVRSVVRQVSQR